jgi:4-amino-4-deoxy-L-arabinose transferase-like glycosyltransferase
MNRQTSTGKISYHRIKSKDYWLELLAILGLFVAAILLYTNHLGELPLRDWDEGTFAQVAKEIYQSSFHNWRWLFPTIWQEPYLNKPTLIHSLTALVYGIFGINEFSSRIVGASLTALSVPLLYCVGRELFIPRYYALFSGLVYLTLLPVVRHGRLAMLDGAVLCFEILMMLCVLRSRRDLRWTLPAGISFALICLSKGWLMGILLGAIALIFLLWDTPRLIKSIYLWLGVLLGAVPVLIWQGAQWFYYGENYIQTAIQDQSLNRIFEVVEGNQGPIWYYLLELLKYPHPWLFFALGGLTLAWQYRNWSWSKLILVWTGIYFLAISLMGTKLPWYILPIYPPLALATAVALGQIKSLPESQPYPRSWLGFLLFLTLTVIGGIIYFYLSLPQEEDLLILLILILLTFVTTTILISKKDDQFILVLSWGMYVSLMLFCSSNYWLWELNEAYPVKLVASIIKDNVPPQEIVYTSFDYERPSLNFYSEHRVIPASLEEIKEKLSNNPIYLLVEQEKLIELNLVKHNEFYCQNQAGINQNISQQDQCLSSKSTEDWILLWRY